MICNLKTNIKKIDITRMLQSFARFLPVGGFIINFRKKIT